MRLVVLGYSRMSEAQRIARLEREVQRLQNAIVQRPLRTRMGGRNSILTLLIDRGNTLSDGVTLGINYSSSEITTVPSAYDPNVTSTFIDGIGRATLYIDGVAQSGYVLVVNDTSSGAVAIPLLQGWVCVARLTPKTILVGAGPESVQAYVPLTP